MGWIKTTIIILIILFFVFVVVPFGILAAAFWAAEGSWDFEKGGIKYWLFMKNSRAEKIGLVSPAGKPVAYSVRLQEGTFPGWTVIQYESSARPEEIADEYARRCQALKLKINERKAPDDVKPPVTAVRLVCEIEPYLDVEVYAVRKSPESLSEVGLRVWGSD